MAESLYEEFKEPLYAVPPLAGGFTDGDLGSCEVSAIAGEHPSHIEERAGLLERTSGAG